MVAIGVVAAILILWSTVSRPLDRRGVTSAVVFMVAGLVVGGSVLGLFDVELESAVAERLAEIALVLLLFSDAMRVDLRSLRHELSWPARLLLEPAAEPVLAVPLGRVVPAAALRRPPASDSDRLPASRSCCPPRARAPW